MRAGEEQGPHIFVRGEDVHVYDAAGRCFVGVTLGAMSVSGITANRRHFEPLLSGCSHIAHVNRNLNKIGDGLSEEDVAIAASRTLRARIEFEGTDTVAAFIAEPAQSAGSGIPTPT